MRWLLASAGTLVLCVPGVAAHQVKPEEVVARLQASSLREAFDITQVVRDPAVPRLLIVRVGSGWYKVSASQRRSAAERWHALWQSSVRNGIVAVLDGATGQPLVNYNARGRALLKERAATPARDE